MFSIQLENESGSVVDINDGVRYHVLNVSGLNPPAASVFMSKSPNRKGGKYNGSTLNERSIILTVKLLGDVEENRNALYAWTETEQYVKVYYRNGIRSVYCEGYVEECAVELYTDNETMDVAIICADPYFKDLQTISADISALLKQFAFPFAIDEAGVPFSTVREGNTAAVLYDGAETGTRIVVAFRGTVTGFSVFDSKNVSRVFEIKKTFSAGDVLEINGDASPKTVKIYYANGTNENALKYVVGSPTWFTLKKGYNYFGYSAETGVENIEISINFTKKYLGV